MGAAVGTDDKGSVNVELNIVPFIDLMSCLTAFLLVTAAWANIRQLPQQQKGLGLSSEKREDVEPKVELSVLVQETGVWVSLTRVLDFQRFDVKPAGQDWDGVVKLLKQHKKDYFSDRDSASLAAENKVAYQQLISAMDNLFVAGFSDVAVVAPSLLPAKPQE